MSTTALALALALAASGSCAYEGPERHPAVEFPLPNAIASANSNTDAVKQVANRAAAAFDGGAISMAVSYPSGELWSETIGAGDSAMFQWASVGKTFTASAVMQLIEEGELSLDDPVSKFVDDVPNGDVATIRDLLGHTAGLPNAPTVADEKRIDRPETFEEELALLNEAGPSHCPGALFAYSNSGYAILAEAIEVVTGKPWREVLGERIIARLAFADLIIIDADNRDPVVQARPSEGKALPVTAPGAAAPVAGTARGMARFWREFLKGRVVSDASLDLMFDRLHPFPDGDNHYGLGVQLFDLDPPGGASYYLGHLGGLPGINTSVIYSPKDDIVVAVAVSGKAPAAAISAQLLRAASGDDSIPAP